MEKSITKATYQKYPAYKDSGVAWLGEIPEGWEVSKIKFFTEVYNGNSLNETQKKMYESENLNDLAYVSSKDIELSSSKINYNNGLRIPSSLNEFKTAPKNSSLLCIEGGSAGRKLAFTDQDVYFVNKLACFKTIKNSISSKFIFYSLQGYFFQFQFSSSLTGMIGGVSIFNIKNFNILIPPLPEQQAIAAFLDDKTEKIDRAIAQKERLIELLKERKQILIQNAVTKGLDPNVKMKDSGVEWIGEIPEHWEVTKLKYYTKQIVDGAHFTPTYVDEGIPFLRVTDISNELSTEIDWAETKQIPLKEHLELIKRANPEKGDVLISKNGTIGITKVIDWDNEFSFFVSLCLLKFKKDLDPYFFCQFFDSPLVAQQITFGSSRTSVTNLHLEKIKELLIVIPPIKEQNKLTSQLLKINENYRKVIISQQSQIEKLKEYKASLIDSAVTGKIKVRGV